MFKNTDEAAGFVKADCQSYCLASISNLPEVHALNSHVLYFQMASRSIHPISQTGLETLKLAMEKDSDKLAWAYSHLRGVCSGLTSSQLELPVFLFVKDYDTIDLRAFKKQKYSIGSKNHKDQSPLVHQGVLLLSLNESIYSNRDSVEDSFCFAKAKEDFYNNISEKAEA
ncbi:hypothetical protein KC19_5G152700 [Ceratodon purpureus]|uniref:Uncharacterized protein n=1 Tax=Ceratodon purpureus TaxID=3225 RepID=A0A8T0I1R7_CERPU|nr:hypothetical protein KC19_5G152700 [Ceratodon purpureus]